MRQAIKARANIPPIVYPYTGQENLKVMKDLIYNNVDGVSQTFDAYYPSDLIPLKSPTVLFVNGGGNIKQNFKEYRCFTTWGELAALKGVVGAIFN